MLFRVVMIVWCCALTVVAAANHVPTRIALHQPVLPVALSTHCNAAQLSDLSEHGASCSCGKGPITVTHAGLSEDKTAYLASPSTSRISSDVRLAVAVVEADTGLQIETPQRAVGPSAISETKIKTALFAHLKQRESWGRYPSKSELDASSVSEAGLKATGINESAARASFATAEPANNAVVALSVGSLEELFRVREGWREEALQSKMENAQTTAKNAVSSEEALEVAEANAQTADQPLAAAKTEIEEALSALLEERASWGTTPAKTTADALPQLPARTTANADSSGEAVNPATQKAEDLRAYLERRETWGRRIGGLHRSAKRTSLAAKTLDAKVRSKRTSKKSYRSKRRRVRTLERRQSLRAFSTQRTWQERVLFPL